MGESFTQLALLKFPGDRAAAIVDEHLLEELRVIDQVFLQQSYLFLEQFDSFTVFQLSDFLPVVFYMMPVVFDLEISLHVALDILCVIAFMMVCLFFISL
jgi:hypothetical protein